MRNWAERRTDRRLVFALVVLALACACGRSDTPRLKVTALPANESPSATEVLVRYQLRNVGGRPLTLDGAAPVCGCVSASPLPAMLAPGASTFLDLQCRSPRTGGSAARELRLLSSDPSAPETLLRITLPARGPGADPAALYFGYVAVGDSAVQDVVLPAPVAIESVALPAESALAVELMPARVDAPYGVRVRLTPRVPGVLRATIDLGAALGALPIVAVAHAGLLAFPPEIRVPSGRGTGLPAITLVDLGDEPAKITRVDYPPGLTGELRTVTPGRQFRLVLRGRGYVGTGRAAISLRGAAGEPLVTIPVVGSEPGAPAAPRA